MTAPPSFGDLCEDLLRAGRAVRFTATGVSMAPSIRAGDVLHVEPVAAPEVRPGDVILYRSPRGLTAHRVLAVADPPAALRCRGDAPGSEEEPVDDGQVLGRVTGIEPAGLIARFHFRIRVRIREVFGARRARSRHTARTVTNPDVSLAARPEPEPGRSEINT